MTTKPYITCRQLIELILDYVAGSLGQAEHEDFERHLERCRSCQAYLETYRRTMTLASDLNLDHVLDDVPEELVLRIIARTTAAAHQQYTRGNQ